MSHTMMMAERISAMLNDDGQLFTAPDGSSLDDVAHDAGGSREYRDESGGDTYRWTFRDGSALTVSGDAWDVGYADCYCWRGVGHSEECAREVLP